jgi:glycosyltransferase involved in cell wall biosynthesis
VKVLHIDTERTWRGGEQQVTYLVEGLEREGVQSVLAAPPDSEIARRFTDAGREVRGIPMRGEADPVAVSRLASCIRRERFDVVHLHTSHAHALGALAARWAATPCVVTRRVDFEIRGVARLKYRYGVSHFIAITEAVGEVLRRAGVRADRITVVPSGIETGRFAGASRARGRDALGLSGATPVVGTVAHFAWHKGLPTLIRAWPRVRERVRGAQLVLVGRGEDEALLRDEVAAAGVVDSVHFAGFRNDVPDCLAAFDVFAMPSVMEGMGTSILDAFAVGLPVVASRVGGIPEIVEPEVTGLLVAPSDPDALSDALVRMLEDREMAKRVGEEAKRRVGERFSAQRTARGTLDVYRRVT